MGFKKSFIMGFLLAITGSVTLMILEHKFVRFVPLMLLMARAGNAFI